MSETGDETGGPEQRQRLDRWLWFARFFKSRSLAAKVCGGGRVRVNGAVSGKAHHPVKAGDVLSFPQGPRIRIVKVLAPGPRRGPAAEARLLYQDLEPLPEKGAEPPGSPRVAPREPGAGRPTKAQRRATDKLLGRD